MPRFIKTRDAVNVRDTRDLSGRGGVIIQVDLIRLKTATEGGKTAREVIEATIDRVLSLPLE